MARIFRKIIESPYPPNDKNVLWLDLTGDLKSLQNGKWISTTGYTTTDNNKD